MQAWPRMARTTQCRQHRSLGGTLGVRFKVRAMACAQHKHVPLTVLSACPWILCVFPLSGKRDSKSDNRHESVTWMSGGACLPPNLMTHLASAAITERVQG